MTAINSISSMTSTAAYPVADDSKKTDATKKAGHHGHHGGHHRAEAPAPAAAPATTPGTTTGTASSSLFDVTA